jgi:hypothetical protein
MVGHYHPFVKFNVLGMSAGWNGLPTVLDNLAIAFFDQEGLPLVGAYGDEINGRAAVIPIFESNRTAVVFVRIVMVGHESIIEQRPYSGNRLVIMTEGNATGGEGFGEFAGIRPGEEGAMPPEGKVLVNSQGSGRWRRGQCHRRGRFW